MVDYASLRLTAERLIEASGRSVTLTKRDRTADNSSTPWTGPADPGTDVTIVVIAVMLDYKTEEIDGTLVIRGDQRCFIADKSVVDVSSAAIQLHDFDTLTDGAIVWHIENAEILEPGSTRIMYEMQLRK